MEKIKGKVILITGGAQGLGKAICQVLACEDNTILIADLQYEKATEVIRTVREKGCQGLAYTVDLCNEQSIAETIQSIKEKFGRLDVLINNAGVDVTKSVMEMSIGEWDRVINVNLRAPFLMAKSALPLMAAQHNGHIINIISTAALRGWTEASAYHASKWGLRGFTQALFTEARRDNIKVSAIIAGGMKTPFLLDRFPDLDQTKLQDPMNVAQTIKFILTQPAETIIPEVMVLPLQETSWP
ncbi:MAG TPA: SDR family oxidoreductase [Chitinophagaceae bacterium]|nr:SDR family oxidoreductase [Chitinophagaceae bacterium]